MVIAFFVDKFFVFLRVCSMIKPELRNQIVTDYVHNKLSLPQVRSKYGVSFKCIIDSIKKAGYTTRGISEGMKKYAVDENYFKKIDSHAKAQVLGFIAADGCLTNASKYSKVISINLNIIDIDYLEWIRNELKFEGTVKRSIVKTGYKDNTEICRFTLCNQILCQDIQNLGITERKSLTLGFPSSDQVPDEFIPSYILGYFEGDGSFSSRVSKQNKIWAAVGICCTKGFGLKLQNILKERGIKSSLYQKRSLKERNINSWSLRTTTSQPTIKFLDWLYENAAFKMQRKYQKYQEFRQQYDKDGNFTKRN